MAFNASSVKTRYQGAGKIKVQKSDFTKMATDLLTLETFAATATSNAGCWSKLLLAEVTATPATNWKLTDINTGGFASSTDLGKWKQILLGSDRISAPATNIQLIDINTGSNASTANGQWKNLLLDKSVTNGTNIAVNDLRRVGNVFVVQGSQQFVNGWNSLGTGGQNPGLRNVPYFLTTTSIGTDSGSPSFFWTGITGSSNSLSSSITMMMTCNVATVFISGSKFYMPVVGFSGGQSTGGNITMAYTVYGYQIVEA